MSMTITKIFDEKHNIWKITCDSDHMITSWKEGDDIKSYNSFNIAYCPADTDIDSIYRLVSKEYNDEKMKECEEVCIREAENNNN